MPKNKMIAKGCPKCEQQVPVACKACPCGHLFFSARKTAKVLSTEVDIRRRTQRTKTRSSESANDDDLKKDNNNKSKRKKIKKEEDEDDEIINNLSSAKQNQCGIILDEINRKLQLVTWNPS